MSDSPRTVNESGTDDVADLVKALDLGSPRPVHVVSGGAADLDATIKPRLRHLFGRGVARAAAQLGAVIVDGGTRVGVMELMGAAVADLGADRRFSVSRRPPAFSLTACPPATARCSTPIIRTSCSPSATTGGTKWR